MSAPVVRTDLVDVYVFRMPGRESPAPEFLQLRRAGEPLAGTWQPVMGHIHGDETGTECAMRELEEETGLGRADPALLGVWALQGVHPYFIAALNAVMLSPRFAARVSPGWEPALNGEHDAARWVPASHARLAFLWPGQHEAIREIIEFVVPEGSTIRDRLRVH